ncbi:MAG: sigma-70 region 4 domain-containing protein [Anaerolineae bacterium]|nr:sigma-70 region 4 domain-containing protein [Anaerolineae bacterium]
MEIENIPEIIRKLPPRQKEVLILVCQRMKYKEIAATMGITENSVKSHMVKIYQAFEIDWIESQERRKVLFQRICYYVHELELKPEEGDERQEPEPEPGPPPERVRRIVEEDEQALILWEPKPIAVIDEKRKGGGCIRVVLGIVVGFVVMFGIGYALLQADIIQIGGNQNSEIPTEEEVKTSPTISVDIETPVPTNLVLEEATQIESSPPDPSPRPSNTPVTGPPSITISMPYSDTFDLRMRPEWESLIGSWRVVDGHMTADNFDDWARILTGDLGWQNYSIDVDVWADDWFYPVQIIVRAQDSGYLAMEINIHNTDFILFSDGVYTTIAHSDTGIDDHLEGGRYKRVYHLRVVADQDIFSVYVDGMRILQVQDTTYGWGRVGVAFRTFYDPTWFDNFTVTAIP